MKKRSEEVTDRPTNTQTHRQDRLQYTAPQLSVQCNIKKLIHTHIYKKRDYIRLISADSYAQHSLFSDALTFLYQLFINAETFPEKKRSERRKHRRRRCSKAEQKNFAPPQTLFPGAWECQNLISWRWSLYLYLQTQFGEDQCTQFRVVVVTDRQTHKPTHKYRDRICTLPSPI